MRGASPLWVRGAASAALAGVCGWGLAGAEPGAAYPAPGRHLAAVAGAAAAAEPAEVRLDEMERKVGDAGSAAKSSLLRQYAAACLRAGAAEHGAGFLAERIRHELRRAGGGDLSSTSRLGVLPPLADLALLLQELAAPRRPASTLGPAVTDWLLGSDDRLGMFLDLLCPEDDPDAFGRVVQTLFQHDPKGRDRYAGLILALAAVWDQPRRRLHGQMGERAPASPDVVELYDYFRDLYESRDAAIAYAKLTPADLLFVVDTPVPLSELRWARGNVRGSAASWQGRFSDIRYDDARLQARAFQWPHGPYTLAGIERYGGICVDQAYFATITARAHGIPAMIFVGEGSRGPHAWFGYMKGEGRWELDAGRYSQDRYAVGHATHPQTNQMMTDHDVEFMCDRSLRSARFATAMAYGRLALVLLRVGEADAADRLAAAAVAQVPLFTPGWNIQEERLRADQKWDALLALLGREADAFRRYPDATAAIRSRQADVLRRLGRDDEATRLLDRSQHEVDRDRDDLARAIGDQQVRQALSQGDPAQARQQMEAMLKDQREEGYKVLGLIREYLDLTKRTGQTAEAARFLGRYCENMNRTHARGSEFNETAFLEMLLEAYENNGDRDEVERLRKRMQRARAR